MDVRKAAEAARDCIVSIRREFHQHPELSMQEFRTAQRIEEELDRLGIPHTRVGETGVLGTLRGEKEGGRAVVLRADIDALPIEETHECAYRSQNPGVMHACGHDAHAACLLGGAKILAEHRDAFGGEVRLVFQPAEEIMDGANDMIAAGILENPHVDAAMAMHVLHDNLGKAGYTRGTGCGSSDVFTIKVKGVGGHGAAPHLNVDPINVACHIQLALQTINSREINPNELIVLTICSIHGGTAANIMPDEAVMQGTIRTMNMDVKAFARQRLIDICEGVCKTFRAECEIDFIGDGIPPMYNDDQLLTDTIRYIDDLLGESTAQPIERMTGSEDFSALSVKVPSVLYWFGTGSTEEGYNYGVHDCRVTFNEEAIHRMAAVYTECAMRWLEEHQ